MPFNDEGEECDFCELTLEEGEQFTDVRLGCLTQPQPVTSRGIQGDSHKSWSFSGQAKLEAILTAMREMDGLEFEVYEAVQEVREVGGATHFAKEAGHSDEAYFTSETNHDKTAAELRFHPEAREHPPDAKLCPRCVKLFE